jgi:hypothetical protein
MISLSVATASLCPPPHTHIHTHGLRPELKTSSEARHVHDTTSCALDGPHFYFYYSSACRRVGLEYFMQEICAHIAMCMEIYHGNTGIHTSFLCTVTRNMWPVLMRLPDSSCRLQLESGKTKHRQLKCLRYRVLYESCMHSVLHGLKLLVHEALSY